MLQQNKNIWKPHHEIPRLIAPNVRSILSSSPASLSPPPSLKVGFLSCDFGVHPVSSLIRGVIGFLNVSRVEAYVFISTKQTSWWRENITAIIPSNRTIDIFGLEKEKAAKKIYALKIDILIDLSGLTLHSGLNIFGLRPCPIQISFLGFPMSTGTTFIDYFIGDKVSIDPAISTADFTEHLIFTPSTFFVNDYAQVQSHVMWRDRPLPEEIGLPSKKQKKFIFASFSNFGKINPTIFSVWANILKRTTDTVLWLLKHPGHEEASVNLKNELKKFGVNPTRLIFTDFQPWIHHILSKSNADLILDTTLKNGHTSTADALWAGVPVLTLCGERMSVRIASSIVNSLSSNTLDSVSKFTIVRTLREYEDVAVKYAKNRYLSKIFDRKLENSRIAEDLFNTKTFTNSFEILLRNIYDVHVGYGQRMHLYSGPLCYSNNLSSTSNLPISSKCGIPKKVKKFDMPYDPFTEHFYSSGHDEYYMNASLPHGEGSITDEKTGSKLQFYYIHGRSKYKDWKNLSIKTLLKLCKKKRKYRSSIVAIYIGAGIWSEYKLVHKRISKIIKSISIVLKPGGKLFFVLNNIDTVNKLIEKLLPRYNFCNVKYDNNKRFGLFYEDELYYEQMQKKASNTLYYLSALRCVKEGEENISVNVEIAGRAETVV
jgi:hypothetical protein